MDGNILHSEAFLGDGVEMDTIPADSVAVIPRAPPSQPVESSLPSGDGADQRRMYELLNSPEFCPAREILASISSDQQIVFQPPVLPSFPPASLAQPPSAEKTADLVIFDELCNSIKSNNKLVNASLLVLGQVYNEGTIDQKLQAVQFAISTMEKQDQLQERIFNYMITPLAPKDSPFDIPKLDFIIPAFLHPPMPTSHSLSMSFKDAEEDRVKSLQDVYEEAITEARRTHPEGPHGIRIQSTGFQRAFNSFTISFDSEEMLNTATSCLIKSSIEGSPLEDKILLTPVSKSLYSVRSGRINPKDIEDFLMEDKSVNLTKARACLMVNASYFFAPEDIIKVEYYTSKYDRGSVILKLSITDRSFYAFLRRDVNNTLLKVGREHYRFYENILNTQCTRCHRFCHRSTECNYDVSCPNCAGPHSAQKCRPPPNAREITLRCHRCMENNSALQGSSEGEGILHSTPWSLANFNHAANFHDCPALKADREYHRIELKNKAAQFYAEQRQMLDSFH